ncbi:MAG: hypothetical protein H8E15_17885 [Planctomycetes bacterium]|nr:hypothetical protein [Planctomycetota bacterium]
MTTEPQESTLRDYGVQPIVELMAKHKIERHDLVAASTEQITHKMVARACKGRRLTKNVQQKVRAALNAAANSDYSLTDLFNYK